MRPVEQRETKRERIPKRHHHRVAEIRKNQPEIYIKMGIYGDAIGEESWRDAAGSWWAATAHTTEITRNRTGTTTPQGRGCPNGAGRPRYAASWWAATAYKRK
jgi:hypothetical protein